MPVFLVFILGHAPHDVLGAQDCEGDVIGVPGAWSQGVWVSGTPLPTTMGGAKMLGLRWI